LDLIWQLSFLLPELILTGGILFILFIDLILRRQGDRLAILSLLFYIAAFVAAIYQRPVTGGTIFNGELHPDSLAYFFRLVLIASGMMTVFLVHRNPETKSFLQGELHLLIMGTVVGGMFMVMSSSMIMAYLSIEFVSFLSYILTAMKFRDAKASEGAIKYVIFGGVASGIMLFGLSYLYGIGGSLDLLSLRTFVENNQDPYMHMIFLGSIGLVFTGLAYKVAVAPFHAWCPDVYEAAATPITSFFASAPKIAGFGLLIRFFAEVYSYRGAALNEQMLWAIGLVSVITMSLGNLAAIRQTNLKRLFAYSSIAHAGYALAAFTAYSLLAAQAISFYMLSYLIMNTGAFLVLIVLGSKAGDKGMEMEWLNGMAKRGTWGLIWSIAMGVFLVSLTGLPPTVGFIGKFYLFSALIEKELYWLVIAAVLNTVVSLFFYARILRAMFLNEPSTDQKVEFFQPLMVKATGLILFVLTLVLGLFPHYVSLPAP